MSNYIAMELKFDVDFENFGTDVLEHPMFLKARKDSVVRHSSSNTIYYCSSSVVGSSSGSR